MVMSSQPTSSLTVLRNVEAWQKGRISPGDGAGAPGCSGGALVCSAQVRALDALEEPLEPALRLGGHSVGTRCHRAGDTATGLGTHCHRAGRACWGHPHTEGVFQGQPSGPGEAGEGSAATAILITVSDLSLPL